MLLCRPPLLHPGIVARINSPEGALLTLSGFALAGSVSGPVADWVAQKLPHAMESDPIRRIQAAYQMLPTRYVKDGVDDFWQSVDWTMEQKTGDCEDSTTALTAILSYLGLDARIALMPGHAAVVIPVDVDDWGRRSIGGWMVPAEWTTFVYRGRQWLGLETTLSLRAVPGESGRLLWQAAAIGSLWIGPSMAALLRAMTPRPLPELALTRAIRRRRTAQYRRARAA